MNRRISVIIPTYNRAALVQQAVESVLAQRGPFEFEVVVVDDGSTAETEQGLRRFRDAIRYVRQSNAGLNPARNHGLRLVTGDYVALLDDDDIWLPFKTRLLMAALMRFPNAGFVHSNFYIWKPGSDARRGDGLRSWFPKPFAWEEIYAEQTVLDVSDAGLATSSITAHYGDLYHWSLYAPMVLPSTAIVRRSALSSGLRFPEVDSVGDWEFFARLSRQSGGVFVPTETTLNRSHEDAVRLTRVDPTLRLRRRVAFIHRMWRQDDDYMRGKSDEVDAVEAECHRKLAKFAIAKGDNPSARDSLKALHRLRRTRPGDFVLWALAWTPFSGAFVKAARAIKARWTPRRVA